MSSSFLPQLSANSLLCLTLQHSQPLALQPPSSQFTFRPVATKAEKYDKLTRIDQQKLQRPRAHFRNALKTTEGLERVAKRLEKRLRGIKEKSGEISFERLSAFRDAFDEIIKLHQTYKPQLNLIKDVYNEQVLFVLSQQEHSGRLLMPSSPMTYQQPSKSREDILNLRKKVHQFEVESRVLLHENDRLSKELSHEVTLHEEELARIHHNGEAAIDEVLNQLPPPKDYAAKVEELQLKIEQKQDAIGREYHNRRGSVPLSVCHNLEQCLREVEIETQKHQRRNNRLREDIKRCEQQLLTSLQERKLELTSDLETILGLS